MKIAVISDTHGLLREEVRNVISGCDAVLHGGDINSQKILDEIRQCMKPDAPLFVVRGNNDKEWAEDLPHHLEFMLGGTKFYMIHNRRELPDDPGEAQVIVFGHSHKYLEEIRDGRLWLNPGSCGKRRFHQEITMAVLETAGEGPAGKWKVERVEIPHEGAGPEKNGKTGAVCGKGILQADPVSVVGGILQRMDKGKSVEKIAAEMKLDRDFVEDVCRIRVTHPGVTVNGIVDKMEVNQTGCRRCMF